MKRIVAGGGTTFLLVVWFACGGKAVIDPAGAGGKGSGGATTSQGVVSTATGPSGCQAPGDCPPDSVCVFATGECADVCAPDDPLSPCGPGEICDPCATGSCPACDDCVAACVPVEPGQCDDHDDCGSEELCVFGEQRCTRACGPGTTGCPLDNQFCDPCATSSCPGCLDCLEACLPI